MKTHTITRWFDDTTNQYVVSFDDYRELHLKLEIAKEALEHTVDRYFDLPVEKRLYKNAVESNISLLARKTLKEIESAGE